VTIFLPPSPASVFCLRRCSGTSCSGFLALSYVPVSFAFSLERFLYAPHCILFLPSRMRVVVLSSQGRRMNPRSLFTFPCSSAFFPQEFTFLKTFFVAHNFLLLAHSWFSQVESHHIAYDARRPRVPAVIPRHSPGMKNFLLNLCMY